MDRAALNEICELMGETKTRELLADFALDLGKRFASEKVEAIALDAHATISPAGMFGFLDLVGVCRTVEEACRAGSDVALLLLRLKDERRRVLRWIVVLRKAA